MMKIDGNKVKKEMKEKGYTKETFCENVGISASYLKQMIGGREPPARILNSMCYILGCSADDILLEEKTAKAADLIDSEQARKEREKIMSKLESIENDLGKLAKVILSIQKTSEETKAQQDMCRDEINAVFNKVTEVNAGLNRTQARIAKRYGA